MPDTAKVQNQPSLAARRWGFIVLEGVYCLQVRVLMEIMSKFNDPGSNCDRWLGRLRSYFSRVLILSFESCFYEHIFPLNLDGGNPKRRPQNRLGTTVCPKTGDWLYVILIRQKWSSKSLQKRDFPYM